MFVSDGWNDYELLDCGDGERLERWGKYILVRPDPQVIWKKTTNIELWNRPNARYVLSGKGRGKWEKYDLPPAWTISYKDLFFNVRTLSFKHTGIFPEQAANWDWIREQISKRKRASLLNLFAYTGAASLSAAAAGADVCHVDAARGMVTQARENAMLSGLQDKPIRWIVDDCSKFLARQTRRGSRYDCVIMDPPSYGRGPSGEMWRIEAHLENLIETACGLLSENPLFVLINTYSAGLSPNTVGYMLEKTMKDKAKGSVNSYELGLRVKSTGVVLPCGASTGWSAL